MTGITPAAGGPELAVLVGRLVAVNVGLPRDVDWRGRIVRTAVWKRSVAGPVMVRAANLEGDRQGDLAGHGGPHRAVLVYQLDSYAHWQAQFSRDDFEDGQFGENFTVDGLPDAEVCIGDQYQIGDALFEVSQPRVTCYRVGLRLSEPQLPALMVSHRRPGFYFRVLREGLVEAGNAIVKVASGAERMSVATIDALLYLPGHDRVDLDRALQIRALSPGWQESFKALLAAGEGSTGNVGLSGPGEGLPAWSGFRQMRVVEVIAETDDVVSVVLTATEGPALPTPKPGQFVALSLDLGDGRPPSVRSYSLSGSPKSSVYRVSVKREPDGTFSRYVHANVHRGTIVHLSAPRGTFVLDGDPDPILLVSAGIGVTPLLSMLHALAEAGTTREVWWLHGARSSAEHVFAGEVESLLAQLSNHHSEICHSAPLPTEERGRDFTHLGRLTADFLVGLPIPTHARAYICGPQVFMDDVRSGLTRFGLDPEQVHTERFGGGVAMTPGIAAGPVVPAHPPLGEPGTGPAVTFARSGLTVPWRQGLTSVLELAEACDVPTRWSCRTGVCHTCEVGLLAGQVTYEPAPVDLPAPGRVLVCCSVPADEVVLDL